MKIPVGKTYYYNLVITLNYLTEIAQETDIDASFTTRFGLKDISETSPSDKTLAKTGITPKEGTPDFTKTAPELVSYTDDQFDGSEQSTSQISEGHYYTYTDSYTFDTTTGTYTLVNHQVCKYSECYGNLANKYIILWSTSTSAETVNFSNLSYIQSYKQYHID